MSAREPYTLVVGRPVELSPEAFDYAATAVQKHAESFGLDVTIATDDRRGRAFRRLVRAWPLRSTR